MSAAEKDTVDTDMEEEVPEDVEDECMMWDTNSVGSEGDEDIESERSSDDEEGEEESEESESGESVDELDIGAEDDFDY